MQQKSLRKRCGYWFYGSTAAAEIIGTETGVAIFSLDMIMSGEDYFEAMYRNIDTVKEALE